MRRRISFALLLSVERVFAGQTPNPSAVGAGRLALQD
jgi:hypothetical protein